MNKIITALKSRTVWAVVLMFLVGGVESIAQFIPDNIETLVLALLGVAAGYFRLNPRV